MQLVAERFGGFISSANEREYGKADLQIKGLHPLLQDVADGTQVWMSHGDKVEHLSDEFILLASTQNSPHAAIKHKDRDVYALQFHPEVHHSACGKQILTNFLYLIAGLQPEWSAASFVDEAIAKIREKVGKDRVILGLSGGVDSSVAAALLHKAIGKQLIPIFVDTGMMRFDEANRVRDMFRVYPDLKIDFVDVSNLFLTRLKGVSDPERKRKIIGNTFIDVFEREASQFGDARFLAQGTLYPDVIESVSFAGPSVTIKSHHNVGGLPEKMNLRLIEPLRELFKDEVREVGRQLQLPEELIGRHPFPGPGLACAFWAISTGKVKLLQAAMRSSSLELRNWDFMTAPGRPLPSCCRSKALA